MSAVRNTGNSRNHGILPYSRPSAKKSPWSISGFLTSLNPFRYTTSEEPVSDIENDNDSDGAMAPQSPGESLSRRGHEMSRQMNGYAPPNPFSTPSKLPRTTNVFAFPTSQVPPADHSPPRASASPAKNFVAAKQYLAGKAGQTLNENEVEGLLELLENSEPAEENVPFRFTSTTPFSPERGRSPALATARKTLRRNPNGTYRWEGAGSARRAPSRNRYSSPAFGPSRSRSEHLILRETQSEEDTLKADTKRRRVGEEATTSAAMSSGDTPKTNGAPVRSSAPEPSPTRAQQAVIFPISDSSSKPSANGKVSTPHTPSRLRIPPKPTAPVNPSPLRQAWSGGSPSSQNDSSPTKPPPPQKQTKAANFMTELIKEVTPPKRPDLSNPYQTASPVKPTTHTKPRVTRRTRATGKPTVPEGAKPKEKPEPEKAYSPQAIIEATLPKGSKRSRPPANLEKSTSAKQTSTTQLPPSASYVVEEEDEEAEVESSARKRSKTSPEPTTAQTASSPDVIIEEMDDVDSVVAVEKPNSVTSPTPPSSVPLFSNGFTQPTSKSAFSGFKPAFAPKEPSKLRTSYQPDSASSPAPSQPTLPPVAAASSTSLFGVKEDATPSSAMEVDPKETAIKAPIATLPTYSFLFTTTISAPLDILNEVKALPVSSLPTFDFTRIGPPLEPKLSSHPPVKAFDFATAGMKPTYGLQNPAEVKEQCTVCDTPRAGAASISSSAPQPQPSPAPSAPSKGFDWAAAGMKQPPSSSSEWTCGSCMLRNPASATEKCSICDAPR